MAQSDEARIAQEHAARQRFEDETRARRMATEAAQAAKGSASGR